MHLSESVSERNAYILMERINDVPYESYLLSTRSSLKLYKYVAELSVCFFFWCKFYKFTLQISNTTNVIANMQAQYWSQSYFFIYRFSNTTLLYNIFRQMRNAPVRVSVKYLMSNAVFPGLLMRLCWTKSKITACEPRNMPWMNAVLSTAGVDWVAPACSNIDAPHTGVKASTPGTGWQPPYRQHCFLKGIVEIVWILAEFPFSNISQMNQYWFIYRVGTALTI